MNDFEVANGLTAPMVGQLLIPQAPATRVYRWRLIDQRGRFLRQGSWGFVKRIVEREGDSALRVEQQKPSNKGVVICKQIWERAQTLPTQAELSLYVATYLLKMGVEEVIRLNCDACSGDAQNPDGLHTCGWPIEPLEIAHLVNRVNLQEEDVDTFLARVVPIFAPHSLLLGVGRSFIALRDLSVHEVIQNDGDLTDMYQSLFDNLRDIESAHHAVPGVDLFNMV